MASWHADSPEFIPLLGQIQGPLGDVLGDSEYASRANAQYVADRGGVPYLKPKSNATPKPRRHPAWKHMVRLFQHRPARFNARYRYRVNVEGKSPSLNAVRGLS